MSTHTATYTDRYIAAATRALPERVRADLTAELEASVSDAIGARIEAGEPADAAERAVLTDLGDPAKLAADYADRPLTLIGPRYFLDWWRTLKLLLWIVPAVSAVGITIVQVLAGAGIGEVIGAVASTLVSVIVHVGFWVTLTFAILERTQPRATRPLLPWTLDQLPELRAPGLGRGDMITSLVFLALVPVAVAWDRLIGFLFLGGQSVPVLDPALWPWSLVALVPFLVVEGALAVAAYRRARWTTGLAVVKTVSAAAFTALLIWAVVAGMLLNPALLEAMTGAAAIAPVATAVTAIVIALAAAYDVVDTWRKALRDSRP